MSDSGTVTVNVGDFILAWDLVSFLIFPRGRETYQMSLMRSLIEEHLYHSLIGHGKNGCAPMSFDTRIGERSDTS